LKPLIISLFACFAIMSGCGEGMVRSLPPSATLGPPANSFGPVEKNAWLMKVQITDSAGEDKWGLEGTLTNNLLRFLREGRYFRRIELLPGKPQADDYVLQFRFDRYQPTQLRGRGPYRLSSDLSATLTITTPDGQMLKEAHSSVMEEHAFIYLSFVREKNGWKARTAIIEDLLGKALHATNPAP